MSLSQEDFFYLVEDAHERRFVWMLNEILQREERANDEKGRSE